VSTPACGASDPTLLGSVAAVGAAKEVVLVGPRAFVASAQFGLAIVDVSTPSQPTAVGVAVPPFYAERVAVSGTLAVLTGNSLGLKVVDVSDPTRPLTLGALAGTLKGVQAEGTYAYTIQVVPGNPARTDLIVIDLATPSAPAVVGRVTVAAGTELRVAGGFAYVAAGGAGLQVVDVRTPTAPRVVATRDTPGSGRALTLAGAVAYVADGTAVVAIDIRTPTEPVLLGSVATSAAAVGAAGTRLYVIDGLLFKVFDVTVPGQPVLRYSGTGWGAQGVAAAGTLAYLASPDVNAATGAGGLYVVDTAVASAPRLLANLFGGFENFALGVEGTTAVVAGNSLGLRVVDVRDPTRPQARGTVPGTMKGVAMSTGGYACALQVIPGNPARTELAVVDVRQPATPAVVGRAALTAGLDIEVAGGYAFVPGGLVGLQVVDVRTPSAPAVVATVDTPGSGLAVALAGGYAYVADGAAVVVVDVRQPTAPVVVGTVATAATVVAAGSAGRVYALGGQQLKVLDVTGPSAPVVRGTGPSYGAQGLGVLGTQAFLATPALNHFDTSGGVYVVDVTDAAAPRLIEQMLVPGTTRSVAVANGLVYVGDSAALVDVIGS
jgi:hypothetical protein